MVIISGVPIFRIFTVVLLRTALVNVTIFITMNGYALTGSSSTVYCFQVVKKKNLFLRE